MKNMAVKGFKAAGVSAGLKKSGHKDQAVRLYKLARDADPENDEIKEKINVITASLSTGSKYDYLLNENLMNTEQLKEALAMLGRIDKPVVRPPLQPLGESEKIKIREALIRSGLLD